MVKTKKKTKTAAQVMAELDRVAAELHETRRQLDEARDPELRKLLARGGHTPATLAEASGVRIRAIYEFQNAVGRNKCPIKTARALAPVLRVSVERLCAAWERFKAAREKG